MPLLCSFFCYRPFGPVAINFEKSTLPMSVENTLRSLPNILLNTCFCSDWIYVPF